MRTVFGMLMVAGCLLSTTVAVAEAAVISKDAIWKSTTEYKRLSTERTTAYKGTTSIEEMTERSTTAGAAFMGLKKKVSDAVDKALKDMNYDKVIDVSLPGLDPSLRSFAPDPALFDKLLRNVDDALAAAAAKR